MKFEVSSYITQTLNSENVQEVNQTSEGKLLDKENFEILESSIEIQEDELISFKLEEFVTAYDQSGLSLEDFLDTAPLPFFLLDVGRITSFRTKLVRRLSTEKI